MQLLDPTMTATKAKKRRSRRKKRRSRCMCALHQCAMGLNPAMILDIGGVDEVEDEKCTANLPGPQAKKLHRLIPGIGRGNSKASFLASRKRRTLVHPDWIYDHFYEMSWMGTADGFRQCLKRAWMHPKLSMVLPFFGFIPSFLPNNLKLSLTIGQKTPFPYLPMLAIMVSLVCQQVVQMSVFAYAGYMVQYLGVVSDKDKAGYYAGVLSSAFMIGRVFSAHFWGVVSDRYSSWYVILLGLLSTVVFTGVFGLSTTFTWAFVSRFLLGLLNGITVAAKPLVSEVCGKEHETVGMGVLTTAWSIGTVLGPGIGGLLAEPAKQHPQIFSEFGIFGRYPYLLPNLVAVGLALLALPLVLFFFKDVHLDGTAFTIFQDHVDDDVDDCSKDDRGEAGHGSAPKSDATSPAQDGGIGKGLFMNVDITRLSAGGNASAKAVDHVGGDGGDVNRKSLLSQPHIRALLLIDGVYSFAFSGFDEVFSLWSLSTVAKGGMDWSSLQIGQLFFVCGLSVLCFDMVLVPHITPRLGIRTTQRLGSVLLVPLYIVIPMISTANAAGYPVGAFSLVSLFTGYVCSHMVYVGLSLAVNNATTPDRRGELNGISMVMSSLARSISPIVCSMMFAFSINGDHSYPFDYHLVFYFLAAARLGMACLSWNRIDNI